MPKIRHLDSPHPSYPSHCRSTASTQDLYPRSLGILGFSGCVGGFFMPKNGYLDSSHPSYALRARSAGAPPKNRGTSIHKCAFCYFSHSGLACLAKA